MVRNMSRLVCHSEVENMYKMWLHQHLKPRDCLPDASGTLSASIQTQAIVGAKGEVCEITQ